MKVLMLLILLSLLFSSQIFANEKSFKLDKFISNYKQKQFNYDYEKNEAESSKLHDSWIAPIRLNFSFSKSKPYTVMQTNTASSIVMDQPIFQSGGIYYGIKFAQASRLYSDYSTDVAKRKMIKDTISILMQIKQTSLKIKKQELQIKNSDINLEQKKEQYLSGQLDSGFLDNAIIQRNTIIETLYDIQTTKEKLISKFESLSDLSYKNVKIPHLNIINNREFIKYNIVLKRSASEVEKNRYYKNVTIAKYLPKVSFTAGYNWQKSEGQVFPANGGFFDASSSLDYYDYGIKISMPLDINSLKDIESARVDYLKSKIVEEDKKRELKSLFEQVFHNIENFDKKIALSRENIKIYAKLSSDTKDLYKAGYKTKYDVETLENSLAIQNIDTKIYEIDKQLELLALYEMYVDSGA